MTNKVKVHITPQSQGSTIEVDGVELKNVTALKIEAALDCASRVTVSFIAKEVDIEGETEIVDAADDPNQLKLGV